MRLGCVEPCQLVRVDNVHEHLFHHARLALDLDVSDKLCMQLQQLRALGLDAIHQIDLFLAKFAVA
ncbi:hypothetical protein D3C71_2117460 [compost metagenome]